MRAAPADAGDEDEEGAGKCSDDGYGDKDMAEAAQAANRARPENRAVPFAWERADYV
jgi:hypothetical protein